MEKIKIFACSEASEPFTKEICDYLKIPIAMLDKRKDGNNDKAIGTTIKRIGYNKYNSINRWKENW